MTSEGASGAGVKRVLLTILGINPKAAQYQLADKHQTATLAPAALFELLPRDERPDVVIALCTEEADVETLPQLKAALSGRVEILSVCIPPGDDAQAMEGFLSAMVAACDPYPKSAVIIDVTHGPRHLSFLAYTGALYLATLGRVTVDSIYYARFAVSPETLSPFIDLRPLLELPRWIHALETLRETGSAKVIAGLLRGHPDAGEEGKNVAEIMVRLSDAHGAGLPIDLGREVDRFFTEQETAFRKMLGSNHRLPLAREVGDQLHCLLGVYELEGTAPSQWRKKMLVLDENELKRQAHLITDLLNKGNLSAAVGLMNEWTVSWVLWSRGETADWLDFHQHRRKAAGLLGSLGAVGQDSGLRATLSERQQRLGRYWFLLCELRNALHHHGMRKGDLLDQKFHQNLEAVRSYWNDELQGLPTISLDWGSQRYRHLLVSPIGERPGVLYSAVKRASAEGPPPDFCLVICSPRTEAAIPDALSRAGFRGGHCLLRLEDPHAGIGEIGKLTKDSRQYLAGADEVSVNITGGTTLMGVVAEKLAQEARQLARPVHRFALIDRRSQEDQKQDPFVEGEILMLDQEGSNGDY